MPLRMHVARSEHRANLSRVHGPGGSIWFCDPARLLQSPKTPESRKYEKKTKSPTPGWHGPQKYAKRTPKKNKKKQPQKLPFWGLFFVFFRYFFRIFGGHPGVGDFVFFRFSFGDSGVFGLCSRPAGSQTWFFNCST